MKEKTAKSKQRPRLTPVVKSHAVASVTPLPVAAMGRSKTRAPKTAELMNAQAFVDPSRLISSRLFLPYNPSILVTRKGMGIFDQMKRDEQVKAALAFKKLAVMASGWEVTSPKEEDAEWEVTTFVRDVFEQIPGGVDQLVKNLLLGLDYGYSITEKVYAQGSGQFEGKVVPQRLVSVKPHYFEFITDPHGELLALLQTSVPGEKNEQEFPPAKFMVYTHDREFENWYGRSDLEAAYRAWWTKDNAYKWLAVLLERYGMPPLFALFSPTAYQGNDLVQLKKVMQNIQNATMGMIPRKMPDDLEMWHAELAGQAKDVFLPALSRFDADIAKALLQPSLTGFSTEGGQGENRGSLARANVSWKAFLQVVGALQNQTALVVNTQFIPQLCDLNWAGLKAYPLFGFGRLDDETENELFKTWLALVQGKIVNRIEDDEVHIRKSLGFPENENVVLQEIPEEVPGGGFGKDGIAGVETKGKKFSLTDDQFEQLLEAMSQ